MDFPILSTVLFAGVAATFLSYTGRRQLANLILIAGLIGVIADTVPGFLVEFERQQDAARASFRRSEAGYPADASLKVAPL